jgi:hypothetical protein
VVRQLTQGIFNSAMTTAAAANPAAITLLLTASADLGLYSQQLLEALLARAGALLQQQVAQEVQEEQGFSGRQLGLLLHSLARLGLRPASGWLKVALAAAGGAHTWVGQWHRPGSRGEQVLFHRVPWSPYACMVPSS